MAPICSAGFPSFQGLVRPSSPVKLSWIFGFLELEGTSKIIWPRTFNFQMGKWSSEQGSDLPKILQGTARRLGAGSMCPDFRSINFSIISTLPLRRTEQIWNPTKPLKTCKYLPTTEMCGWVCTRYVLEKDGWWVVGCFWRQKEPRQCLTLSKHALLHPKYQFSLLCTLF